MGKHEIQIIRILIEGGITAFAIMLFCMEMNKLGLIYGAGWYMTWIIGLSLIAFPVWFLLESGVKISFDSIRTPQPVTSLLPPKYTPDAITKMITETVHEAMKTQEPEEQFQPDVSDDDVKILSTRATADV
jgi:hypothetical protein